VNVTTVTVDDSVLMPINTLMTISVLANDRHKQYQGNASFPVSQQEVHHLCGGVGQSSF
jgi:hypothetical protein